MNRTLRAFSAGLVAAICIAGVAGCPPTPPKIEGNLPGTRSLTYERAMTTLLVHARSPNATVRANCVEALEVSDDPRARGVIEQGLSDKEPVVRFASAMAVGKRRDAMMKPRLLEMSNGDLNTNVSVAAIYALYRIGDSSTMQQLTTDIQSKDLLIRANTYMVLGLMGNKQYLPLLISCEGEKEIRAKFELTAALARLGDEKAINVITGMVYSKVAEMEWNALTLCGDLDPEKVNNALLTRLKEPLPLESGQRNLQIRRQLIAARSLAKLNLNNGLQFALDNLADPAPDVRALAALALGEALNLTGEARLKPLLEDPDASVRIAASAAVINIWSRMANTPTEHK